MGSEVFVEANREARGKESGEDSKLVSAAQAGDAQAFDILIERYHAKVYSLVYRMCGAEPAEDITQDIFVRAVMALREFQYRGEASFRTWLFKIAVNTSINWLRQRRRRRQIEGPSLDEPVETDSGPIDRQVSDVTYAPHQVAETRELQRAVCQVIEKLSPKQRGALVLVDLEGLEYQQAAEILGCPLGTLKSRLVRARATFAAEFERHMNGNVDVAYLSHK